jgi:uncharacterized protein (TIGR00730 family)
VSVRSVCVFCGSNPGRRPAYLEAVGELATLLATRGVRIVYGGNSVGTMGALADCALAAGGEVVGVVPEQLAGVELLHDGLTELHLVGSMHERKALMGDLADGFVALPGGLGTLEELAEVLTWSQIGLHHKPVGLLNTTGYYVHLLAFLDHAVAERFLRPDDRALVLTAATPAALLDAMGRWRPREDQAWASAEV